MSAAVIWKKYKTPLTQDEDDFYERCKAAALIGTLQAGFTKLEYLGRDSEEIFDDLEDPTTAKEIDDMVHTKVNFPPFQHYRFDKNNSLKCVGKSHWKGDLTTGYFDKNAGKMTDELAKMLIMMCERYATRANVRGYSYNDEMKGQAILQLVSIGLQFDESKSDNPFAYLTSCIVNSFVRIINIEKRHREIRDDILEMNGLNPSFTRSSSGEYESSERRNLEDYD